MQTEPWSPVSTSLPIPPPALADLLGGHPCAKWLRERHDALARSPAMVERAAAVGLVARLWGPEDRATRAAVLEGTVEHPAEVAVKWLRSLDPETRSTLYGLTIQRAARLRDALFALVDADADPSEADVLALLHERDTLECVRVLLAYDGYGRSLGRELALTDVAAVTCYSAMPITPGIEADPLLRAVFLAEPDAWWGEFAAPSNAEQGV